jgi:hypothetical protein
MDKVIQSVCHVCDGALLRCRPRPRRCDGNIGHVSLEDGNDLQNNSKINCIIIHFILFLIILPVGPNKIFQGVPRSKVY